MRAFTFDNIDVLLGTHPGVTLEAVQGKFVGRGRGGYCFEHATLFAAVLERLGYDVRRLLGRVGPPTMSPRTHCVIEVSLDGERLLADPGFGMSVLRPIPLEDGAEDDFRGWRYQVRRADPAVAGPGWELHRLRESGWELMHTTDELPVQPVDVTMGHHFTSTYPTTHFRHGLMLNKHSADRHTARVDRRRDDPPPGRADRAPRAPRRRARAAAARARGAADGRRGDAAARRGGGSQAFGLTPSPPAPWLHAGSSCSAQLLPSGSAK